MKLSVKISLFVTTLAVIISIALISISYRLSSRAIVREVQNSMVKIAEEGSERINLVIEKNIAVLTELSDRARTKTLEWNLQKESLIGDINRLGYLDFAIVNKNGIAKYVSNNNEANLGDREYIKKAFNGVANVSNPIVSRVTNSVVVMYAVPIKVNGKIEQVLIARADGTFFNQITDNLKIGEKGYAFILGEDSTMYAYPVKELVMEQTNIFKEYEANNKKYISLGAALKKNGLKSKGIMEYIHEGSTRIVATHPVNNTSWTMFIGNHKDEMLKGVYKLRTISIVIAFIFSLISLIAALILSQTISIPIKHISEKLFEGAGQTKSASQELSHASQELANANAEQAANIEETATSLDETSAMVQQNTEYTKQAKIFANQTKEAAEKGNIEMEEMNKAMIDIKKSSNEISNIIKVIENIAFQTNILALNAAVEAARAGDAGMGFAVVAEEVRNLAQRSSDAAKETADMINESISKTDRGVEISGVVMQSLQAINGDINKLDDLMEEILTASEDQTNGIVLVNKSLNNMGEIIQGAAGNAEQTAAAAEELDAQSESMRDIVRELVEMIDGKNK